MAKKKVAKQRKANAPKKAKKKLSGFQAGIAKQRKKAAAYDRMWRELYGKKPTKPNPPKMKRVTKSSGWLKADAVRFVKKGGKIEVYLRRNKKGRRK